MDQDINNDQKSESGKGVRLWPETIAQARSLATSHVARYNFAKKYVEGKNVCDIACGVGYGSNFLSQTAKSVIGIDISSDAVDWAKKYFSNDNIQFLNIDGCQQWPVEHDFGVITSFETMEHVESPDIFLKNLYDHLEPGGILVLSVPNGPRDEQKTDNPHHLHYFDQISLQELIGKCFSDFQCYSQAYKKNFKHYACKLLRKIKVLGKQLYFVDNYYLADGFDKKLKTWVVIARK